VKPTKITNLITAALLAGVAGFFVIQQLVGNGFPAPTIELNLVLIQPSLAIILVLSAIPMFRYRSALKKFETEKGKRPSRVDSTYAVRTVALAKSVSLTGSIFAGWALAVLVYQLMSPEATRFLLTILGLVGAIVMVGAGLLIENSFRIPPDRDTDAA
jgi:ABC-type enterochelin transport system permease subunit